MITIIKMGQVPVKPPEYRTTCPNCHTVFEHNESDCIFVTTSTDFYIEKVQCPLCKINTQPQKIKQPPDVPKPTGPLNNQQLGI